MPFVSVLHTSSNRLLLSNQDKGCTPCAAHSLPLPLGPALLNLWTILRPQDTISFPRDTILGPQDSRQVVQSGAKRKSKRMNNTIGVHPLSWLLSNNRLEKVPFVSVPHTSSNQLLLSNQDKGCIPSFAHSLALPLGPALLNLWTILFPQHTIFFP